MFRRRFQALLQVNPNTEPVEGFIFRAEQQALKFGSDRRIPVQSRPVLPWRRRDNYITVLPMTSKQQTDSSDFFSLDENEVQWLHANSKSNFINCHYEIIQNNDVGLKIAVISQNARMNITHWLGRKYS